MNYAAKKYKQVMAMEKGKEKEKEIKEDRLPESVVAEVIYDNCKFVHTPDIDNFPEMEIEKVPDKFRSRVRYIEEIIESGIVYDKKLYDYLVITYCGNVVLRSATTAVSGEDMEELRKNKGTSLMIELIDFVINLERESYDISQRETENANANRRRDKMIIWTGLGVSSLMLALAFMRPPSK